MVEKYHRIADWVMNVPDTGLKTRQRKLKGDELKEWENMARTVKRVTYHEGSVVGAKEKTEEKGPWRGSTKYPDSHW